MLCEAVLDVPVGPDWLYEFKFDGYRALAIKSRPAVRLISRNGHGFSFPEVSEAVAGLKVKSVILEGEMVALDQRGAAIFSGFAREWDTHLPHLLFCVRFAGTERAELDG